MQPLLQIQNLSISFKNSTEIIPAVQDVSLSVMPGKTLAIVGESGSGKSVTALSILNLLPDTAVYKSGQILFSENGTELDLRQLSTKELQQIRGNCIATIFQEPMTSLNPVMTCGRQVMEALLQHKNISKAEAKKITIDWLRRVKLPEPESMFHRYPHQLSGGQKQRVMIAIAMCCNPSLLLCDEPTTALDVTVQKSILQLIKELQEAHQMSVIFITHDLGVVAQIADTVAILYRGQVIEEGDTQTIFRHPKQPYTKALIACRPALHPKGERLPVVADFLPENADSSKATTQNPDNTERKNVTEETLLSVQHLTIKFPVKTNIWGKVTRYTTAVNDVSFEILNGETLGLVGESGCGKTTLGRSLLQLIPPSEGTILFKNKIVDVKDVKNRKAFRKEVQLVFQDPYSSLNPRLTIGDALEEPMLVDQNISAKLRRKKVTELLDKVSLPSYAANRYPHQFSGGQRQRIVIARALSVQPDFLVCDESVSALDVSVQAQVLNLLNDLKKELGLTLLFISHDLSVVRYMSDRMLVMKAGRIIEEGPAEDIYHRPQSDYTKKLLAAIPHLMPQ